MPPEAPEAPEAPEPGGPAAPLSEARAAKKRAPLGAKVKEFFNFQKLQFRGVAASKPPEGSPKREKPSSTGGFRACLPTLGGRKAQQGPAGKLDERAFAKVKRKIEQSSILGAGSARPKVNAARESALAAATRVAEAGGTSAELLASIDEALSKHASETTPKERKTLRYAVFARVASEHYTFATRFHDEDPFCMKMDNLSADVLHGEKHPFELNLDELNEVIGKSIVPFRDPQDRAAGAFFHFHSNGHEHSPFVSVFENPAAVSRSNISDAQKPSRTSYMIPNRYVIRPRDAERNLYGKPNAEVLADTLNGGRSIFHPDKKTGEPRIFTDKSAPRTFSQALYLGGKHLDAYAIDRSTNPEIPIAAVIDETIESEGAEGRDYLFEGDLEHDAGASSAGSSERFEDANESLEEASDSRSVSSVYSTAGSEDVGEEPELEGSRADIEAGSEGASGSWELSRRQIPNRPYDQYKYRMMMREADQPSRPLLEPSEPAEHAVTSRRKTRLPLPYGGPPRINSLPSAMKIDVSSRPDATLDDLSPDQMKALGEALGADSSAWEEADSVQQRRWIAYEIERAVSLATWGGEASLKPLDRHGFTWLLSPEKRERLVELARIAHIAVRERHSSTQPMIELWFGGTQNMRDIRQSLTTAVGYVGEVYEATKEAADLLAEFLEKAQIGVGLIGGASMGGGTAQAFAAALQSKLKLPESPPMVLFDTQLLNNAQAKHATKGGQFEYDFSKLRGVAITLDYAEKPHRGLMNIMKAFGRYKSPGLVQLRLGLKKGDNGNYEYRDEPRPVTLPFKGLGYHGYLPHYEAAIGRFIQERWPDEPETRPASVTPRVEPHRGEVEKAGDAVKRPDLKGEPEE